MYFYSVNRVSLWNYISTLVDEVFIFLTPIPYLLVTIKEKSYLYYLGNSIIIFIIYYFQLWNDKYFAPFYQSLIHIGCLLI